MQPGGPRRASASASRRPPNTLIWSASLRRRSRLEPTVDRHRVTGPRQDSEHAPAGTEGQSARIEPEIVPGPPGSPGGPGLASEGRSSRFWKLRLYPRLRPGGATRRTAPGHGGYAWHGENRKWHRVRALGAWLTRLWQASSSIDTNWPCVRKRTPALPTAQHDSPITPRLHPDLPSVWRPRPDTLRGDKFTGHVDCRARMRRKLGIGPKRVKRIPQLGSVRH